MDNTQLMIENQSLQEQLKELREAFSRNTFKLGYIAQSIGTHGDAKLEEIKAKLDEYRRLRKASRRLWKAVGIRMMSDEAELTADQILEMLNAWKELGDLVDPKPEKKD